MLVAFADRFRVRAALYFTCIIIMVCANIVWQTARNAAALSGTKDAASKRHLARPQPAHSPPPPHPTPAGPKQP